MLRENVIHGLPAEDEWRYQLVQGSSFFRSKVYALTAVVFELLIRRIGIFCPIEILVMSASVVGTAIADIRSLIEGRTDKRSKLDTMFGTVADF